MVREIRLRRGPHGRQWRHACAVVLALFACSAAASDESRVKAAFIEKLTRFIEWPEQPARDPARPFVLCLIGRDTLDGALDELAKLVRVKGHVLQVRYLDAGQDVSACNALFISSTMANRLPALLQRLAAHPILTIGDTAGYARQGVMVNFYVDQGRLRFEINPQAAEAAGLRVGARVLKLARIVTGGH